MLLDRGYCRSSRLITDKRSYKKVAPAQRKDISVGCLPWLFHEQETLTACLRCHPHGNLSGLLGTTFFGTIEQSTTVAIAIGKVAKQCDIGWKYGIDCLLHRLSGRPQWNVSGLIGFY